MKLTQRQAYKLAYARARKRAKANRRKWLQALRSGKYKQARDTLARDDNGTACAPEDGTSFCCLGVAALVCGFSDRGQPGSQLLQRSCAVLGLTTGDALRLAERNDDKRQRFKTIADAIEKLPLDIYQL